MDESAIRFLNVKHQDILNANVADFTRLFGKIAPEDAQRLRGKVVLGLPSFDSDPRPNWAIPEIRRFIQALDKALPFFPYFLVGDPALSFVLFYLLSLLPSLNVEKRMYDGADLIALAFRKAQDVRRFAQSIDDDVERAAESLLLNLPTDIVKDQPDLVEKILDAMRVSLLAMRRDVFNSAGSKRRLEDFEKEILFRAARLCDFNLEHYSSEQLLLDEVLRKTQPKVSNDDIAAFESSMNAATERIGGGKLAISSDKLRAAVKQQKHAAYAYVDAHIMGAAAQPGYLQPAVMVATAILVEFSDNGPLQRIQDRANELGVDLATLMPGTSLNLESAKAKFTK